MNNRCPIHNIELTPSFDVTNLFCFKCETETKPKSKTKSKTKPKTVKRAPKKSKSSGVLKSTGIPRISKVKSTKSAVSPTSFIYYAVVDSTVSASTTQFERLFKTRIQASRELSSRVASLSPLSQYTIALVTSTAECIFWYTSGMSKVSYAIWSKGTKPTVTNGNHAEVSRYVKQSSTATALPPPTVAPKSIKSKLKRVLTKPKVLRPRTTKKKKPTKK